MREDMGYNETEYLKFEGNRFLIIEGALRDVHVENKVVRIPDEVKEIRRQAFLDAPARNHGNIDYSGHGKEDRTSVLCGNGALEAGGAESANCNVRAGNVS